MLGRNPGIVTTQGEIVSDLLRGEGYPVVEASSIPGRARRLADLIATVIRRRRDYDLIWLQVFGGPSIVIEEIISRLGGWLGKPILMTVRGGAMPTFMARYPRLSRGVLRRAQVITVPSAYLQRALAEHGLESRMIPNVIRAGAYPSRLRRELAPRLLWMRTFHPLYNPALAVRTLAGLRRTRPDATLVMAGQEKGIGDEVRALARELGVSDATRFAGFLDLDGKAREFAAADVFLNTNDIDNTPVSVIEACAAGLPVVATRVGGLADLLDDGETGLLVPPGDADAMTAAVDRLLSDPDLAERLSRQGAELAARCRWDQVLPLWEQAFADAVGS